MLASFCQQQQLCQAVLAFVVQQIFLAHQCIVVCFVFFVTSTILFILFLYIIMVFFCSFLINCICFV